MSFPASGPVQVGSILRETYEITALLGYGGMGSVYVARHLRLPDKLVAVKVLHAGSGLSEEVYKRFKREAMIASRLGHPNIVEVLDFDTLPDSTPFLVLELLRGESLAQRLRRGPLNWEETLTITRQVGSALRAAHRAGVVHRDLKPDNIFLMPTEQGGVLSQHVKLLDFGISKIVSESNTVKTQDAVLMGTPLYMSPEQALGKNSGVDARTDIFALGSILYEAMAGQSPFAGENIPQIIYRIVHEQPVALSSLCPSAPPRSLAAIDKALAKDLNQRYPNVESFVEEFTGAPLQMLGEVPLDAGTGLPRPTTQPRSQGSPGSQGSVGELDATFLSQNRPRPASQAPSESVHFSVPSPVRQPSAGRAPQKEKGSRLGLLLGLAVAVLAAAGAGRYVYLNQHVEPVQPTHPTKQADAGSTQPDAGAPVASVADAGSAVESVDAGAGVGKVPVQPGAGVRSPGGRKHPGHGPRGGDEPPVAGNPSAAAVSADATQEALDDVRKGEKALRAGDTNLALEMVRLAERANPATNTYSLTTRIYCQRVDIGNAKAQAANVPRAERAAVERFCAKFDIQPF